VRLRREARWLWPIAGIMVVAVVCAAYILTKQRLESPLADRYSLSFEFEAADAVTAGLGAPLTVAGVEVGQIDGVKLENGRAVVRASVDRNELPHVYAGATAALVPNTPLKDMQIRLYPGRKRSRALPSGSTIQVAQTSSPIDADQLLRALDTDTRTWVQGLIADSGVGLKGRARDLNSVLRDLGPTAAQTRRITDLLAARRHEIPKLVHDIRIITRAAAHSGRDLSQVVDAGDATFEALASERDSLERGLALLPGTLDAARGTLQRTVPFSRALRRSARAFTPALARLRSTLRGTRDATRGLVPLPAKQLRQFIDATAPLGPIVKPASRDLRAGTPPLLRAFDVLTRTANGLAYKAPGQQSYLFWLGWFAHNASSMLSTEDAHGAVWRGYAILDCSSFHAAPVTQTLLTSLIGFTGTCPP
jgi:phospholipid/cholesterol/gamma-HCH transport system substrate-binding protein